MHPLIHLLTAVTCSLVACSLQTAFASESTCYGTVSNGRLEDGVALPQSGNNFQTYSKLAQSLDRTYAHSKVVKIIQQSYAALEKSAPKKQFVYGEVGAAEGGPFKPHRTHQNGLSVDFFVPVLNRKGESVPLPTSPLTRYGYDLEFDKNGALNAGTADELRIDFDALAEHIYQLDIATKANHSGIRLVILDPRYHAKLWATPRGPQIKHLSFMKKNAWVRHDEHYHIDFAVKCKSL
jgi:penicillin-insensitive murein DD-endopeptidase